MEDKIPCLLCGTLLKRVSNTHLQASHGISMQQYKEKFPAARIEPLAISILKSEKIRLALLGKKKTQQHVESLKRAQRARYVRDGLKYPDSRTTVAYLEWREICLARDGNKCVRCESTRELRVHHIKDFTIAPELWTTPSNGLTVCESCHQIIHKVESALN